MTFQTCPVCGETIPCAPTFGVVTEAKVIHKGRGGHEIEIVETF